MLFEHEMAHLEDMNELLSVYIVHYMFDHFEDYLRDKEAIENFVIYVIDKNKESIDEPRGKTGRTFREAAKYP